VTDPRGNVVRTEYDVMDRAAKIFDGSGRQVAAYDYDDNGNVRPCSSRTATASSIPTTSATG